MSNTVQGKWEGLNPEERLATARAIVRKKWPYVMSTIYGFIPQPMSQAIEEMMIARGQRPTLMTTKGMVLAYSKSYVMELDVEELASGLVHEAQHILRGFFERVPLIPDEHIPIYGIAADMPINQDLKDAGWKMRDEWVYPDKYGFPPGKTSEEYYELLLKKKPPKNKNPGMCSGSCNAPVEIEVILDSEKDDQGNVIGRSLAERKRIVRRTFEETKQHIETKGRGSVPGWMQQLVDIEYRPSRIPWPDRLQSVIREMTGPIISGGDDYSLKHPSKRSYSRGIARPGLTDQTIVPLFIVDTSGSMSVKQMMAGIHETIAVLTQFGIDEGFLCQVDASVAEEPRRVNLSDLSGSIEFKGRGGTDFGPGFRAAIKMHPRPDLIFYWTDGDGYAPKTPCPIPTVWGVVPHSHHTRRPAPWGTVVTITENEAHPDDDEDNFQKPLAPPAGYYDWDDEEEQKDIDTDMSEYESDDD